MGFRYQDFTFLLVEIGMKIIFFVFTYIFIVYGKKNVYLQSQIEENMTNNKKNISNILLLSLVCTIFISYPNVLFINMDWQHLSEEARGSYINSTMIRFLLFWVFISVSLYMNQQVLNTHSVKVRILVNTIFTLFVFGIYKGVTTLICPGFDCRTVILTFQFIVFGMMGLFLGYTDYLNRIHKKKEEELKQLKMESLQSRCTALTNQINPHFFFNALNGISSLVRKKDDKTALCYIDHLSDIFRYILQSENKGIVTLEEELDFARSFSEVMQVRYAGKWDATFDVPDDCLNYGIPVLALLPLIENVGVHNMIDSEHRMNIHVHMNENKELVVSNPVFPKLFKQDTHGTGLKNLDKRFLLLMDKRIRVEKTADEFSVILPLKS
jgi:sensor histidine kinase YesM